MSGQFIAPLKCRTRLLGTFHCTPLHNFTKRIVKKITYMLGEHEIEEAYVAIRCVCYGCFRAATMIDQYVVYEFFVHT